jgi:hypothetical protein
MTHNAGGIVRRATVRWERKTMLLKLHVVCAVAVILAPITGCVMAAPKEEGNSPGIHSDIQELKEFMETHPSEMELVARIQSMDLGRPFVWEQDSPYTLSYWKLPSGGGLIVYGWGNVTTRAVLKDATGKVASYVVYKTQKEAEAELKQLLRSQRGK